MTTGMEIDHEVMAECEQLSIDLARQVTARAGTIIEALAALGGVVCAFIQYIDRTDGREDATRQFEALVASIKETALPVS